MPTLEEIIKAQRKRLLARESALVDDVERMMRDAIQSLESEAARAAELQQRRISQGQNPLSASITQARANTYIQQLREILVDVAGDALTQVLAERRALQIASAGDFLDAANATDVSAGIDPQAIERIALSLNDGPVRRLFANLPDLAAARARDALFTGVATGLNPRRTARLMTKAADIAPQRAATIARTETLRAYRNAMLDRMQRAPEIEKWVWISARDRRTCAFCWAQHGHVFSTERQMATHPNCRCSQGPLPKGANTTALVGNGKALFDKLKPAEQLAILGPAKFRAFKAGALSLQDLVGHANHVDWGPIGFERSLRGALGNDLAKKYYKSGLSLVPPAPPPSAATTRARAATRPRSVAPPSPPPRNPRPTKAEVLNWDQNKGWSAVRDNYTRATGGKTVPPVEPNALGNWVGRGIAKDHVATELSRRMDARAATDPELAAQLKAHPARNTYGVADSLVGTWAGTSADTQTVALAMQVRAAEKYNVPIPAHLETSIQVKRRDIDNALESFGKVYDAFLDSQYGYTQEMLKNAGITELTLFRGQSIPHGDLPPGADYGYANKVTLQPMSSFSADPATSTFFTSSSDGISNSMIVMKVPADRILGTPITGYGCFNEAEFVVLGGQEIPAHVVIGKPGGKEALFRGAGTGPAVEGYSGETYNLELLKSVLPE